MKGGGGGGGGRGGGEKKEIKNQKKSETRMTASVLKSDPNIQKFQKNAYLR